MKLNDSTGSSSNLVMEADEDDVYFRFGGATLASMLHNRYKDIRKCNAERREIVSLEIKVLHALTPKIRNPCHLTCNIETEVICTHRIHHFYHYSEQLMSASRAL